MVNRSRRPLPGGDDDICLHLRTFSRLTARRRRRDGGTASDCKMLRRLAARATTSHMSACCLHDVSKTVAKRRICVAFRRNKRANESGGKTRRSALREGGRVREANLCLVDPDG